MSHKPEVTESTLSFQSGVSPSGDQKKTFAQVFCEALDDRLLELQGTIMELKDKIEFQDEEIERLNTELSNRSGQSSSGTMDKLVEAFEDADSDLEGAITNLVSKKADSSKVEKIEDRLIVLEQNQADIHAAVYGHTSQ